MSRHIDKLYAVIRAALAFALPATAGMDLHAGGYLWAFVGTSVWIALFHDHDFT